MMKQTYTISSIAYCFCLQELKAADIPHVTQDGITAIVIAGEALGVKVVLHCIHPYVHV